MEDRNNEVPGLVTKDEIEVPTDHGLCKIQLSYGSVTKLRKDEGVDVLVISAFPSKSIDIINIIFFVRLFGGLGLTLDLFHGDGWGALGDSYVAYSISRVAILLNQYPTYFFIFYLYNFILMMFILFVT